MMRWLVPVLVAVLASRHDHVVAHVRGTESIAAPARAVAVEAKGPATYCVVDGRAGPPSYRVADIGKPGVPPLSPGDAKMARAIDRSMHSSHLRFLFAGKRFVVIDAVDGPCTQNAPGYPVLNGACNESYSPTDAPNGVGAFPDCVRQARPWLTGRPHR